MTEVSPSVARGKPWVMVLVALLRSNSEPADVLPISFILCVGFMGLSSQLRVCTIHFHVCVL